MSKIVATISFIENIDEINRVKFDFKGLSLNMVSLHLLDRLKVGTKVKLGINPTHIAIAKDFTGVISYSNELKAKIVSIKNGKILSSVKVLLKDIILESIITLESVQNMQLEENDDVILLIKATEISIVEILDD